ncbi:MAG: aminotransferase class I/II-fold pyridoxal phosphate-dependent enzyme [Epulopiscium sp.]|nr:aminotransferase class I/II-fold pyridoxal phosphate-dependent enzyme [Candidatus Epulonipiscium sp.]
MKAPLYDKLIEYSKNTSSFHMPGHKFGKILNMKEIPLLDLDATEVPGLDNLYDSKDIILEAENKMAVKYGARDSIFLTNGSTSGIIASILSICNPGDSLIVSRNAHHSVWNALILGGIKPIYINPSHNDEYNIVGGICPLELEKIIKNNPEVKGLIIVSPTYEGLVSDIEAISSVTTKYNKILIVDEAHGAHFVWNESFPRSAVEMGADLVIQSMHKTLPAITQSALLHIATDRINKDGLINSLQMVQTSSPSYIMMGLMDYIRYELDKEKRIWDNYLVQLTMTRNKLSKLEKLKLLKEGICGSSNIFNIDISKIVIFTDNTNITGVELGGILKDKYDIQVEIEADHYIIAMSTISDSKKDLERLTDALFEIDRNLKEKTPEKYEYGNNIIRNNETTKDIFTPREIYFGGQEEVRIDDSIGRISAGNIIVFPPGIPLICIGEKFTKETVQYIRMFPNKIIGVNKKDNEIKVFVSKEGDKNEG